MKQIKIDSIVNNLGGNMGKAQVRDHRRDCITMRIKKIYFERILSGDKKAEFRNFTPFYERLFQNKGEKVKYLYLHYQDRCGLVVEVKSLKVVKTPDRLKESKITFGPKVYQINLGKSILVEK